MAQAASGRDRSYAEGSGLDGGRIEATEAIALVAKGPARLALPLYSGRWRINGDDPRMTRARAGITARGCHHNVAFLRNLGRCSKLRAAAPVSCARIGNKQTAAERGIRL
jgi:hypothetical protein